MSFLGKNIRKIRAVKNLTQTEFANLFSLSRTAVGAYEEGRAEPKISTVIRISEYFKLNLDYLLTRELSVYDILHYRNIFSSEKRNDVLFVGKNLVNDFFINLNNRDFLAALPKITFPGYFGVFSHSFEYDLSIKNNSTLALESGDILFCKKNCTDEGNYIVFGDKSVEICCKKKPLTNVDEGFFKILKVLS